MSGAGVEESDMTKEEAQAEFRALISSYGWQWTTVVPESAWKRLKEINKVLTTEADRREALGWPVRKERP